LISVALASLLLVQQAQGLDTLVTLEVTNAPVPAVVKQLEAIGGVKIHVQGAPERDWVYVNFNERPLRQVLDSLAGLCDAKWSMSGDEVVFQAPWPGPDARVAVRERMIDKWLADRPDEGPLTMARAREQINRALELTSDSLPNRQAERMKLHEASPISRAIIRLIRGIGARELSTIEPGEERTYCTERRGRARVLPASMDKIFGDMRRDRAVFKNQMVAQGLTFENMQAQGSVPLTFYFYFDDLPDEKFWSLKVRNSETQLMVELQMFGGEYVILQMSSALYVDPLHDDAPVEKDGFSQLKDAYKLPEEWREAVTPDGMRRDLQDPKIDALTGHMHDAFRKAGETLGTDVAAIISDGAFLWASLPPDKVQGLGEVLRAGMMGPSHLEVKNGVALMRPDNLIDWRLRRIPRSALATYLREYDRKGRADLDMIADLAVAVPNDRAYWHAMAFLGMTGTQEDAFYREPDLLRLYGGLSNSNRQRAKQDGMWTTYEGLSGLQQASLDRVLNSPSMGLDPGKGVPDVFTTTYFNNTLPSDLRLNLPPLLPPTTPILIRLGAVPSLFGNNTQNKDIGVFSTTAGSLAYAKAYMPDAYGSVDQFTQANLTYLQVAVDFSPLGRFARASSPSGEPGKDAKWVTMKEMPAEFQEEFQRLYQGHLEQKKRNGQKQTPPP
jgi:hypothetical protein